MEGPSLLHPFNQKHISATKYLTGGPLPQRLPKPPSASHQSNSTPLYPSPKSQNSKTQDEQLDLRLHPPNSPNQLKENRTLQSVTLTDVSCSTIHYFPIIHIRPRRNGEGICILLRPTLVIIQIIVVQPHRWMPASNVDISLLPSDSVYPIPLCNIVGFRRVSEAIALIPVKCTVIGAVLGWRKVVWDLEFFHYRAWW